jgi:hypothetical protein
MQDGSISAAEPEDRNFVQRLIDVYVAPVRAFEDVARRPHTWWQPLLFVAATAALAIYLTIDDVLVPAALEAARQSGELGDESIDAARRWIGVALWGAPLLVPITIALISLILHGVCGLILGGAGRFVQTLGVTAHGYLINFLGDLIRVPLMLVKGTPEIHLGPAALLPVDMQETLVYRVLAQFDVFSIWKVVVIGIGLSVVHRLGPQRAIGAVVVLWLAWVAVTALLGGLA